MLAGALTSWAVPALAPLTQSHGVERGKEVTDGTRSPELGAWDALRPRAGAVRLGGRAERGQAREGGRSKAGNTGFPHPDAPSSHPPNIHQSHLPTRPWAADTDAS